MKNKFQLLTTIKLSIFLLIFTTFSCSNEEENNFNNQESQEVLSTEDSVKNESDNPSARVTNNSKCNDRNTQFYTYSGGTDVNAAVSATIDDRTCFANYEQTTFGNRTYGVYKLAAGTNHIDDLQPRMERAAPTVNTTGSGSYVRFSGYVTIRRAGHKSDSFPANDMRDNSGTYIAQAKGTHTGGGGSNDPAICLIVAKPIFSGSTQVSFDLYREQIISRGGSGVPGRELVFLTNVPANTRKFFRMENGFIGSGSNKVHYVNIRIGATDYNWNVPEPLRGNQVKIRFGAYRCKGGEAEILWDGVNEVHNAVQ